MYTYVNIKTGKKITVPCKVNGDWELVGDTNEKKAQKPVKQEAVEETLEAETKEEKKVSKKKK